MAVPFRTVAPGFLYRVPGSGVLSEDPNTQGVFTISSGRLAWQLQYQPATEVALTFYVYFYLDGVLVGGGTYFQPGQQAQGTTTDNTHPTDGLFPSGYDQAQVERLGFVMRGPGSSTENPGPVVLTWGNTGAPAVRTRVSFQRGR